MPEPLRRYTFARMKNGKLQIPTLVAASAALFFCSSLSAQGWSGDAPSASSSPESGSRWGNSANDPWVDSSASETEAPESSPAQDDPWGGSSEEASQDDPASDPSSSGWDFSQMPSNLNPELSLTGPSTSSSWRLAGYSSGDFTLNLDDLGLSASADFEVGQFSDLGDSEWGLAGQLGIQILDDPIDLGISLANPDIYYRSYFGSATSTSRPFLDLRLNITDNIAINTEDFLDTGDFRLRLAAGAGLSTPLGDSEDVSFEIRGHFFFLNALDGFDYQILGGLDDFHGDPSTWDSFGSQTVEFGLAVRF